MSGPYADELSLLHSNICKALGDVKRLQILYVLNAQPRHVNALADILEAPQPTVSRHLAILRERGLVTARRDGAQVIYSLSNPEIITILDQMRAMLRGILADQADTVSLS